MAPLSKQIWAVNYCAMAQWLTMAAFKNTDLVDLAPIPMVMGSSPTRSRLGDPKANNPVCGLKRIRTLNYALKTLSTCRKVLNFS